jgi:phosphoesterase RecJ-like protein
MNNLASILEGVHTVAIAGHIRPDGDCMGACLSVYNYICENFPQIEADVYLKSIPTIFCFLNGSDQIKEECPPHEPYDLFIALDCGDADRLGDAAVYFKEARHTVCVDHHVSNDSFADENYIVPHIGSTCELLYDLIGEEHLSKNIAECIYIGMVHDTGVFQYSNTSKETMRKAGTLMELGIDFPKMIDETFYTKSYEQNRILGKVLVDSKLYYGGRLIVGVCTKEDMDEFHVIPRHLEGIVNQLRITKGVEVAAFLYETDGSFKVSLRENAEYDLTQIVAAFGGGGHKKASGCTIEGTFEEVFARLCEQLEQICGWCE